VLQVFILLLLLDLVYDFRVIKQMQNDRLSQQQPHFMLKVIVFTVTARDIELDWNKVSLQTACIFSLFCKIN